VGLSGNDERAFWILLTRRAMSEQDAILDHEEFEAMFADLIIATIDAFEVVSTQEVDFLVDVAKSRGVGFMRDVWVPAKRLLFFRLSCLI
jgi:hypothetical protein